MAYDKNKIFEQAKDAIVEHGLIFVEDIVAYLPCSKSSFYEFYPDGSDELDELKSLLEINRVHTKVKMRKNWVEHPAPALQMALMKLLSTPEELRKLSMNTTAHEGEIKITKPPIEWTDETS
jgi:hypothetical protein